MKRQTGIWIDSSKAIIICLDGKKESITEIDSDIENKTHHHKEGNRGTQFENRIHEQTNHYMDAVIDYVKKSDELYVFGPAGAKTQLKKRILEEHLISPEKLIAVVTSDKMTVNQMVAKVKEFYHL
jgi:hypothetical protein